MWVGRFAVWSGNLQHRRSILVAEDEPIIALDLVWAIGDAGHLAIGPSATVADALALLDREPVCAAILDVNLLDGDITPVVEYLVARGVPLVLHTGVGVPPELAARMPDLIVRLKPTSAADLVALIETMLERG